MNLTFFQILVLQFIKLWIEHEILKGSVNPNERFQDAEELHKNVSDVLSPTFYREVEK